LSLTSFSSHLSPSKAKNTFFWVTLKDLVGFFVLETINNMFWYATFKNIYVYHLHDRVIINLNMKLCVLPYTHHPCAHKVRLQQERVLDRGFSCHLALPPSPPRHRTALKFSAVSNNHKSTISGKFFFGANDAVVTSWYDMDFPCHHLHVI
jgi:hypothetical protein